MTWLALRLLAGGGRTRAVMVAGVTSVVTALLLVALTLLLLPGSTDEALFEVVADPGTRGGVVLAVLLLVVPPLFLLHQALRFGTAARERRLAGLRLAGATPGDVRRLGALEVGLPASVGAALGVPAFGVLRALLGGQPGGWTPVEARASGCSDFGTVSCDYSSGSLTQLVPRSVSPDWWMVLVLVTAVGAVGAVVGARVGRRVVLTPQGVTRRRPGRPPRPWGLVGLVVTPLVFPVVDRSYDAGADLVPFIVVALPVLSIASLGPWIAYLAGRRALTLTSRPATLLAAGRLVADPRPAGRAAAAVGGIGLVAGGGAGFLDALLGSGPADPYYLMPLVLIAVCLLVGLLVVSSTLVVHCVESLGDRRRSVAAQLAQGVPLGELERSLRWEAGLVAVPLGAAGAVLGAVAFTGLNDWGLYGTTLGAVITSGLGVAIAASVVMAGLTVVAVGISARLVRPAVRAAARADNLRTA